MTTANPDHFRIGNQTAFMAATPLAPFQFAVDHRFAAFELFPDKKEDGSGWEIGDLSPGQILALGEEARAEGVELTVHAPWWANPLHPGGLQLLLAHVDFAVAVGATLLNIHLYPEEGIETYAAILLPLLTKSGEAGLKLAIENTPLTEPDHFNRLFAHWRRQAGVDIDHVGVCFDLGHANLCAATRNDYLKFFDQLAESVPIIHLHLHENHGEGDSHLPLFTGPAGENSLGVELLLARLAARGFDGAVILEQWPQPPELLVAARDRLRALWSALPGPPASSPPLLDPDPTLSALLTLDRGRRSWREKLDGLLLFLKEKNPLSWSDRLIYSAIYLRFLATGGIGCSEDGRHFRPNHHAKTAEAIFIHLEAHVAPGERMLLRKIQPYLPSFAAPFMRAEPLTRIRELAHRNDLPHELKQELKHTLQNKLHRCASPEDLEVSAAFLARFRAMPELAPAFVQEFEIFHRELREFFNALSLRDRLRALAPQLDGESARLVAAFLAAPESGLEILLRLATALRHRFATIGRDLSFGSLLHDLRLADLGLEEYLFALASSRIAALTEKEFPSHLEQGLELLTTIVVNLELGMVAVEESGIVAAELQAWGKQGHAERHEWLLRLKATLERCRRLANGYSDWLARVFAAKVVALGRAFGVRENTIRYYCEGELRAHLVFPLSNLVSLLLAGIRTTLGLAPFDVLVPGEAWGELRASASLDQFAAAAGGPGADKVVLILAAASGEEEIPLAVTGIVLRQALPHLSHLGVRARQQGVVLITCEERQWLAAMEKNLGQRVKLRAESGHVTVAPLPALTASPAVGLTRKMTPAPTVNRIAACRLLPLAEITLASGGGKAWGLKKLAELARSETVACQVPESLVIPHGVLEYCLAQQEKQWEEYQTLLAEISANSAAPSAAPLRRLRALIEAVELPAAERFLFAPLRGGDYFMVRSSANTEDLEELAGAGVHESIANVSGSHLFPAVRRVWASLWSERAVRSRAATGLGAAEFSMAVIVQKMLRPDYSFVIHTVHPVSQRASELYIELAVGLGETIVAGATPGAPYRLRGDKETMAVTVLSFADFSQALWPEAAGATVRRAVNYTECELSAEPAALRALGRRLTAVAVAVEKWCRCPQDIEGAVVAGEIYLLQSRAQQGLPARFRERR